MLLKKRKFEEQFGKLIYKITNLRQGYIQVDIGDDANSKNYRKFSIKKTIKSYELHRYSWDDGLWHKVFETKSIISLITKIQKSINRFQSPYIYSRIIRRKLSPN